jgi:hypothetical protein
VTAIAALQVVGHQVRHVVSNRSNGHTLTAACTAPRREVCDGR